MFFYFYLPIFNTRTTFAKLLVENCGLTQTIRPFANDAVQWSTVNLHGVDRSDRTILLGFTFNESKRSALFYNKILFFIK